MKKHNIMLSINVLLTIASFALIGFITSSLMNYRTFGRIIPVPIESTFNKIPMNSFVRFEKVIIDKETGKEFIVAVGSGVVVSKTETGNVILTNHHVCTDNILTLVQVGPTIKRVRDTHDRIFYTYNIRYSEEIDICLVFAKAMQAPPVKIATAPPKKAEVVFNISAPRGIFFPDGDGDEGMAPIIMGIFNGYVLKEGQDKNHPAALFTINLAPGSSGSGIFNSDGELLGLIHSCFTAYDNLCMGVSYKDLVEFIKAK